MKKTRFIPYGYTIREGRTVIEHTEAEIIREIFDEYIKGASLKDIAENLTQRRIPYTEKTDVWDKARIARIIDNAKYIGDEEYDPIIDEDTYEGAVSMKAARQRNTVQKECEGIALLRNRVKCEDCGSPMVRRICSKRHVKESWTCQNAECGKRLRISDGDPATEDHHPHESHHREQRTADPQAQNKDSRLTDSRKPTTASGCRTRKRSPERRIHCRENQRHCKSAI